MIAVDHEKAMWTQMRASAAERLEAIMGERAPFEIQVAWPDSYDELLAGQWEDVTPGVELGSRALECGRVLLSAEAGRGKTHLLARAGLAAATTRQVLPVWVSLRDIPSVVRSKGPEYFVQAVIELSQPSLKPILASRTVVSPVLILADGLNEIPRDLSQLTIDALDELARRYPFVSVIVSERLVRRAVPLERWRLATVLPLSESQVREVWHTSHQSDPSPDSMDLLKNPFFLDKSTEFRPADGNGAKVIEAYFSRLAGLDQHVLDQLGKACFNAYSHDHGMLIPKDELSRTADSCSLAALTGKELIRASDSFAWFSHHLFHDYLASRYLVKNRSLWGRDSFDVVTTGAASFDALRLAVDQIGDPGLADEFVRLVYDWNYFGAAYSLVPGRVTTEMQVALLAMLADKRWDPVAATVEMVTDALRLDGSSVSRRMLSARTRTELFQEVNEYPSTSSRFVRWRTLFTIPDGELIESDLVARLRSEDPVEAWTLANVLRRCKLSSGGERELISIASSDSPVSRWRAVHVLGLHPSIRTAAVVERLMGDPDRWVRYGAVRALVESAAKTSDRPLRNRLITYLLQALASDALDEKMLHELARVLDVQPQPVGWPESVAPLVQQLASTSRNSMQQDRWNTLMANISSRNEGSQ